MIVMKMKNHKLPAENVFEKTERKVASSEFVKKEMQWPE